MSSSFCNACDNDHSEFNNNSNSNSNSNTSNYANSNSKTGQTNNDNLSIFCREVRNLLRSKPNCMIPFSKFVPAYHNHYGRQCCVYQFGYTKLIELLESIPHVVQIIGDGSTNRYITLTHREQIKRFASDLIKVVKSQPGKKLKLSQFAEAYEQVLGRKFNVEDYGTNNINVLLAEIWEGTINIIPIKRELVDRSLVKGPLFVNTGNNHNNSSSGRGKNSHKYTSAASISSSASASSSSSSASSTTSSSLNCAGTSSGSSISRCRENSVLNQLVASSELVNKPYITEQYPDAWFEIPKRERSEKEIKRTKYFVWDVIELLSNMKPNYSVTFSKFIPSYHYYFNRQCKVSIFGFSKLIDLFESISPRVVEIIDQGPGKEKVIKLADRYIPNKMGHQDMEAVDDDEDERGPGDEEDDDDDVDDVDDVDDGMAADEEMEADDMEGDDLFSPIDSGPTEAELLELEEELNAYEELKAIQSKRSSRMAAILDVFKFSVY